MARSRRDSQKWKACKELAYQRQGGKCQICRQQFSKRELVGHHEKNKSRGGRNVPENCVLRCVECEQWAHSVHTTGNPGKGMVARYRMAFGY